MRTLLLALLVSLAGCAKSAPPPAVVVAPAVVPPAAVVVGERAAPAADVVGFLFRDDRGALAIEPLDGAATVVSENVATKLAPRLDACTASDAFASAVDTSGHRDHRVSGVLVDVRGGEIAASADACAWNEAQGAYVAALGRAEEAFARGDAKAARRALEDARGVVAEAFGAMAPHVEVFRFVDGLATRFASACERVAARSDDVVAYADAVTPLRRAKTMEGRTVPFPAESRMVLAAFRFARREVYRALRAERGEAHDIRRARAIVDMAPVGHDVEMFHWVLEHVPEARR